MNKRFSIFWVSLILFTLLAPVTLPAETETDTDQKSKTVETKSEKKPKMEISFKGDVQYRFRYHYETGKDDQGNDIKAGGDYTNRYAWNFIVKALVNEHVRFGLRLSNPKGSATDNVEENVLKVSDDSAEMRALISIPEMCFKWSVGIFSLAGGIIPVPGNTVLGLAAFEDKGYEGAVTSWKNCMNNSQIGIDLGFTFIDEKATSLGLGIVSAVARDNVDEDESTPSQALKNDQLRFIFTLPASIREEKLSLLPCLHLRTSVYRSADKEKANHSLVGGIDIGVNLIKQFAVQAGFAVGGHTNDCLANDGGYDTLKTAPLGMLTTIKLVAKPGYGKGILIFKVSTSKDRETDPLVVHNMLRWDLKYGFPIKGLTIMPRIRVWYSFNHSDTDKSETTEIRPELILMSKF